MTEIFRLLLLGRLHCYRAHDPLQQAESLPASMLRNPRCKIVTSYIVRGYTPEIFGNTESALPASKNGKRNSIPYHECRKPIAMDSVVHLYWTTALNCNCSFTFFVGLEVLYHSVKFWMFDELGSSERWPPDVSTY